MKLAIGPFTGSAGLSGAGAIGGNEASCGCGRRRRRRIGERTIQDNVADHLIVIGRRLLVADGAGHLQHFRLRTLGDLNERQSRRRQFVSEVAGEHGIRTGVIVGKPVERGLLGAGGEQHKDALVDRCHGRKPSGAGDTARAAWPVERVVPAGIEHQDRGPHAVLLQDLDDALRRKRGITHQLVLTFHRRRHIDREEKVLASHLETVA